jgi:hypothetical protein
MIGDQIIVVKNIRDILNLEIYDIYRTNVPQVLFVSYLDLHLEIDIFGHLSMNFYDKRDALLLRTIYLHLSSNVYYIILMQDLKTSMIGVFSKYSLNDDGARKTFI